MWNAENGRTSVFASKSDIRPIFLIDAVVASTAIAFCVNFIVPMNGRNNKIKGAVTIYV